MAEDETASLLTLARKLGSKPVGPECGVLKQLRSHPRSAEVSELLAALKEREISYSVAAQVCKDADIPLSADMLSRHVRQKCSCDS